jgi:hypothetical protein
MPGPLGVPLCAVSAGPGPLKPRPAGTGRPRSQRRRRRAPAGATTTRGWHSRRHLKSLIRCLRLTRVRRVGQCQITLSLTQRCQFRESPPVMSWPGSSGPPVAALVVVEMGRAMIGQGTSARRNESRYLGQSEMWTELYAPIVVLWQYCAGKRRIPTCPSGCAGVRHAAMDSLDHGGMPPARSTTEAGVYRCR